VIERITLRPSGGGRFEVTLDGELIFSKRALERHARPGEIHTRVQGRIGAPIIRDASH
jgi:selenoprotein W-related protein